MGLSFTVTSSKDQKYICIRSYSFHPRTITPCNADELPDLGAAVINVVKMSLFIFTVVFLTKSQHNFNF